jgi:phage terminase Nu1 subunit (DNA packaging protein)
MPDKIVALPNAAGPQQHLNKKGIAELFGVVPRTIERLMAQGLPHLKINKRLTRFNPVACRKWMDERYLTKRIGKLDKNSMPPRPRKRASRKGGQR